MPLTPFQPRNRHILLREVEEPEKENEKPSILLPEDYTPKEEEHVVMQAWAYAPDCKIDMHRSHLAVVKKNMIEEIEVGNQKYKLILENYVLGYLEEE